MHGRDIDWNEVQFGAIKKCIRCYLEYQYDRKEKNACRF